MKKLSCISALIFLTLAYQFCAVAQDHWTGTTSMNWGDANWDLGAPTSASMVYFEDQLFSGYTNSAGVINNILDANYTIGTLIYNAQGITNTFAPFLPNHYYTTFIPGSYGLGIAGVDGVPALRVGVDFATFPAATVVATVAGAGSLAVTNGNSTILIGQGANGSGTHKATLDMSQLATFTANVSNVWIGVNSAFDKASGAILLANNTMITTAPNTGAPGILLGRGMTNTGFGSMTLGQTNVFNTDGLVVGGARASSGINLLTFPPPTYGIPSAATLTLRGSAGGGSRTAIFGIGDSSANETNYQSIANGTGTGSSSTSPSTADLTGGSVDLLVTNLYIGRSAADNSALPSGSSAGTAFGNLTFNNGTINALAAWIGLKQGTNKSVAVGALTAKGNANLTVSNDLILALVTNGVSGVTATINVNDNASVNVGGNLLTKGGTSTINLNGGTINMTGAGSVTANALTGVGAISNASSVLLSNTLTPGFATANWFQPGTINLGGNLTLASNVAVKFKLGSSTTVGGGVNDYLNVGGNLSLSNNNLDLGFAGLPVTGTYDLIDYGGAKSGGFNLVYTNTTRNFTFTLDQSAANHIRMTVAGGPPASLTWKGGASGIWDLTNNMSWNNNIDRFYTFDSVLFDDTGSQTIISIPSSATVQPGNITFSNNSLPYTLYAPGKITGLTGVTKNGTGTVVWDTQGANDFAGPVNINQGVIQIQSVSGTANFFGTTNKLVTIANGASLDIYGNTVGSSSGFGWPLLFSGTGYGGIGAIAHTKASSGPTLYTPQATLAGDATIAVQTGGLNLFVSGVTTLPLGGVLDLQGHTLTAGGAGNVGFINLVITNSGSIQVACSNLTIRDCIVDGAGSINVGNRTLVLGNLSAASWTTGYVAKAISVNNGMLLAEGTGALTVPVTSPVSLAGNLTVSNSQPIRLSGAITGGGGLTKLGSAKLNISGTDTYTGSTIVSGGTLALDASGSIVNSPLVRVDSGGFLDVTAQSGGYSVAFGQTLQVDGTATGNINVPAGATLAGSGMAMGNVVVNGGSVTPAVLDVTGTLTVANFTLNNANLTYELGATTTPGGGVNDLIAATTLNVSGMNTIRIVPIGSLNNSGGQYTLFTYSGPTLPSSVTNNFILTSRTRYSFSFVDPATTPGSLQIIVTGGRSGLTWQGGVAGSETAWNVNTTSNWNNGGVPDFFFNGDAVLFDDTAVTNRVTLNGSLRPAAIDMENNSLAYTFDGAGSLRTGAITNNGGAGLTIANSANNLLSGAGLFLNGGSVTFNQPVDATFTGVLNGGTSVTKAGNNQLTLIGNSGATYFGSIMVNSGVLQAGSSNAFGSGTITVAGGAALDLNGQVSDGSTVAISGAGPAGRGAIMDSGSQQTNALSRVMLNGDSTVNSSNRWDVDQNGGAYFQGQNYALTKVGPGSVWIDVGSDTGLGDVNIQQGSLVFAYAGTDLGSTTNLITVSSNATLAFAMDVNAGTKPVNVQAGGDIEAYVNASVNPAIGQSNVYAGNVNFAGTGIVKVANLAGLNLAGNIQGPAGVVSADRGSLTLSGSNSYSGALTVNLGQASIGSSTALPARSSVVLNCTGIPSSDNVFLNLLSNVVTPASVPLNMMSYRTPSGNLTPTLAGSGTWSGSITLTSLQSDPSQNPQFTFNSSSNLTIAGPITQTGSPLAAVSILGFPGTVRFVSPLQYNGTMTMGSQGLGVDPSLTKKFTTIELDSSSNSFTNMLFWRGQIIIGVDNAIPLNCPITTSAIRTDNDARGFVDLNGHVQTFANVPGLAVTLGSAAMPIWFGNDSTNSDSTIIFNSTITNTWVCWIIDNFNTNLTTTPITNSHKTGLTVSSGYLRLAPWAWGGWFDPSSIVGPTNNAYTGPTMVTGGTLHVDIALSNTVTTVSGTGKLAGVGPFYGPVTIASGGTLSPGGSSTYASTIAPMTNFSTLTLQSGSKCVMEVNLTSKTNDSVVGLSSIAYGGTLIVTNVGAQAFTNGTVLKLFTATNYVAGPMAIQPAVPAAGLIWDASQLAVNGTLRVTSPVPTSIAGVTTLPSGAASLNISGIPGQAYSVRASTNAAAPVATWTILESGTLPGASYNFIDLTSTNYPERFYIISTP